MPCDTAICSDCSAIMDSQASANTYVLLDRYRAGDKSALQTLLQRYYPRVACIVRVRMGAALRERLTEEDVVQEVFLRVMESIDSYERREDAEWINWVARIVQNVISSQARHHGARKRTAAREVSMSASATGPASGPGFDVAAESSVAGQASRRELQALLEATLAELSEDQREVILLREYAGYEWRAVAEQMQRSSPEACQELHRRARQELEKRLARKV